MKSFYPGAGSTGIFFERILSFSLITLIILITRIFTFWIYKGLREIEADVSAFISLIYYFGEI